MADRTQPQVVRNYLAQLEASLAGVPAELSRDILDGVIEELAGLDPADAAARIEELGDPVFIAAEARAGVDQPDVAPTVPPRMTEQLGYIVLTGLLVAVGFLVIPFVGWVVGIVLMWLSRVWSRGEKLFVTLALPAGVGVTLAASGVSQLLSRPNYTSPPTLHIPPNYDLFTVSLFLLILVPLASGIWLLVRGLRRDKRPN